jgi:DNA-binding MarR family transcriptional regulator
MLLAINFMRCIENGMKDPLLNLPGYSLRRAANAMIAELSGQLAKIELRHTDASVLILVNASANLTASALGRKLDIQRANMVPLLVRLEAAGLLYKEPLDGKSHALLLTKAGQAKLKEAMAIITSFELSLMARVPEKHRPHLQPALDALWQNA